MFDKKPTIAIIGGGAAGIFAAIHASYNKQFSVVVFERSSKLLSKVKISGGGRCNVTHACYDNRLLATNYPRGQRELLNKFAHFSTANTINWFEERGVYLKTEKDGRIFPVSDNSQSIIDCLLHEAELNNVKIFLNHILNDITITQNRFQLQFNESSFYANKVIVATGGYPNLNQYSWIKNLGINVVAPVPSLFTFNISKSVFKGLEGVVLENTSVKIQHTKYEVTGPVLITHWGLSGPAVLKLSALAAIELAALHYNFHLIINIMAPLKQDDVRQMLYDTKNAGNRKVVNTKFAHLPQRTWQCYCALVDVEEKYWNDVSKSALNKLAELLTGLVITINGKSVNKDEFVTAGGVSLSDVNPKTNEHKLIKGLYFAGEVLNVDGITGGFNFQHAWTSGYIAGVNASLPENIL